MPETDEQLDEGLDGLETAGRVNFRDYPSSGLVVVAAISSGLGWMLYKWLGRKRKARQADPSGPARADETVLQVEQPVDKTT
jgi:hypothetical protein